MLWALYTLGFDEEANDFFYFIRDVVGTSDKLQVLYGVGGEQELPERTLDHLTGTSTRARSAIGNDAYRHQQHDVWGALLDSVFLHTRSRDGLAESTWRMLCAQVEEAIAHWREPDRGIWEVRGEPKHFTSSKVMCWVACDRGARLARLRSAHDLAARWQAAADEIHADVCANAVDHRGVFTQHYDTDSLDASCLLLPLVRFLPADDERIVNTVNAIAEELTDDGFVLRYRTTETDDGLVGEEARVRDLHVLARERRGGDRRDRPGARRAARRRSATPRRSTSTPSRSTRARRATSATSRRRSRTSRSSTPSCT